jgi:hypothetical protein
MNKIIYYTIFLIALVGGYFLITNFGIDSELNDDNQNQSQSAGKEIGESEASGSTRQKEGEILVYEAEAESADECSAYEQFDAENKVCFYECESEAECKEIGDAIEAEFAVWTDELEKDTGKVEEKSIASNDKSLRAEYIVSAGENISLKIGKDNEKYKQIWEEIAQLSPDSLSNKYVDTYQVFENKSDDTLAFVDDEDGDGKWRIAVNLSGYNTSTTRENKSTFIHELAHIISLNSSQVNAGVQQNSCKNFYLDEGCTNGSSFLNNFQKTFWVNIKKVKNENGESMAEFDENKFVTEYAATNEVEDLAESFAFFVLEKDNENLGDDSILKNQKIKYFYNYPELVSIRKDMRSVLSKDIVRAKKLGKNVN